VINSQSSDATTATILHGYTLLRRQSCSSAAADAEWQFALACGQRTTLYCSADTRQQLDR